MRAHTEREGQGRTGTVGIMVEQGLGYRAQHTTMLI